jgi:hypothetical protein
MKTAPTNKKVREIINMVREGKLVPRPQFQRRLVWKYQDKNHFLDSVIRGYPFPEIYLADGDVDLETGAGTQLLVDGLQRVSTLVQYFNGDSDLKLTSILPYRDLQDDQKTSFLQYDVAVRDLGSVTTNEIVEVFKRINSTSYSLSDIEISNAVYRGELKDFADKLSTNDFFGVNNVFNHKDYRRMGDLRFALLLVVTIMGGYSNRDDVFENFLDRYNDEFMIKNDIGVHFQAVFDFITECSFILRSRVWRKADLFTLIIEVFNALIVDHIDLQPSEVVNKMTNFFNAIDENFIDGYGLPAIYYKAALQASNDRLNRVRRGHIVAGLLRGVPDPDILDSLRREGLVDSASLFEVLNPE